MLSNDWEFNVLGIYNYRKPGKLKQYFQFIAENHTKIPGDIVEAGVFHGKTLLATAMFLKEINSEVQVYGYDSFSGFPPCYHPNDKLEVFEELYKKGTIDKDHYKAVCKNREFKKLFRGDNISIDNISSSGDFSSASLPIIKQKAELLGLDNIHLIEGPFEKTFTEQQKEPINIMAANLDCDLYESYKITLPFLWDRLSKGGYLFLDEYYSLKFPGARIATDDFFSDKIDKPQLHTKEQGDFERWYIKKS